MLLPFRPVAGGCKLHRTALIKRKKRMKTVAIGDGRATAVGKRQSSHQLVTQQLVADLRQVIETAGMLPTQL